VYSDLRRITICKFLFGFTAGLRELDTDELQRLEIQLSAAQQTLDDANLDNQFAKLTTANDQVLYIRSLTFVGIK